MSQQANKSPFSRRLALCLRRTMRFITYDMWRLYTYDVAGIRGRLINSLKIFYISISEFIAGNVSQKASALTYTTLLSLVPFIAVILSVAAGFGMKESVQSQLYEYLPAHRAELTTALEFVQRYMQQIQGGVVIGVGILVLLYSVISLMSTVEDTINTIWHITQQRSWSQRLLGYLAAFVLLPILLALTSGANVFIGSFNGYTIANSISVSPFIEMVLRIFPVVLITLLLTVLYWIMPNTKVRFPAALFSGVVSGLLFQGFQMLYISGQLWVSKYNAIYGSFAAIPLLLLFVQLSWLITLFGVQLTYAIQNLSYYAFKNDSDNVSRRFTDLVALVIMEKVCKAFRRQSSPYTAAKLARECNLPVVIVNSTLDRLCEVGLLLEHHKSSGRSFDPAYLPKLDISLITVGRVLTTLDRRGAEGFKMDIDDEYAAEWTIILQSRRQDFTHAETPVAEL